MLLFKRRQKTGTAKKAKKTKPAKRGKTTKGSTTKAPAPRKGSTHRRKATSLHPRTATA